VPRPTAETDLLELLKEKRKDLTRAFQRSLLSGHPGRSVDGENPLLPARKRVWGDGHGD